jgi:hypothetical protein
VPARFLQPGSSLRHTHPDCIFIDTTRNVVVLLELTVCSDAPDAIHRAFIEKQRQYADLRDAVLPGWTCILLPVPIGHTGSVARGVLKLLQPVFYAGPRTPRISPFHAASECLRAVSRCVQRQSMAIVGLASALLSVKAQGITLRSRSSVLRHPGASHSCTMTARSRL